MYITVKEFEIHVSESELWTLVFTIKHDLEQEDKASHSAQHNGWETFVQNYGQELDMYKEFCERLGRTDLYTEIVEMQKNKIRVAQEKK